ncbi:MAG: tetratricopeptide repeat protein, partial [Terrimicrobiaceae bacterium]
IPEEKRMPVFLSEIAFDGYTWNRHAEHLGQNGTIRLRYTDLDNAPEGREVHWNSAFAWYLRGLGEVYRIVHPDTLRNSIFRMSIWANPILLVLALGIFSTLSARRFGPLCGTVIAIGMLAVPTFYEGFMPAYPDHHGIIAFALMGILFGIAWAGAGWVQGSGGTDFVPPRTLRQARHGMIFSAICGAAGLWISALSTAMVLGAIGLAALVSAALSRWFIKNDGCKYHPEIWKTWALWGAASSFVLYLIEYFPTHMGMRLEVNHPLYALAWIGGGWIVATTSGWLVKSTTKPEPFPWQNLIIPVLCCVVLPVMVLTGGNEVYSAKDPFMIRLYKNIAELLPLLTRISLGGLTWQVAMGWFPILILSSLVLASMRRVGHGTKSTLICLIVPILVITGLQLYQVRWGMLAGPLYIALAGIVIPQIWRLIPPDIFSRSVGGTIIALFGFLFVEPSFKNCFANAWAQYRSSNDMQLSMGQGLALLHRKMARTILDDANGKPVVLLSSPNSSCLLSAIGGFRTVGTLYWENVEGLKKSAEALNAQSDSEALDLVQKLGVTHISMMSWENFIEPFFGILYPERRADKSYSASFGKRALFDNQIPAWSRPLVFPPNDLTRGLQQEVLMLRVAPEQSLYEATFHLARFVQQVEGNPIQAEISYKELLQANPKEATVRLELINLYLDQKRYEEAVDQTLLALKDVPEPQQKQISARVTQALISAGKQEAAERLNHGGGPPQSENATQP